MRNRICFMVAIVVAMLLVACDGSATETSGAPGGPMSEVPEVTVGESGKPAPTEETAGAPVEPATGALTLTVGEPISVGAFPRLAAGDEYVWATTGDGDAIVRIDPATHDVTGGLQGLGGPIDVAVLDGRVWVIAESWLVIDREAVDIVQSMPPLAESYHLAAGFGSLWAVSGYEDAVPASSTTAPGAAMPDPDIIRIDPNEHVVTARISIEGVCRSPDSGQGASVIQLDVSDDAVWALTFCDGDSGYVTVYRIDPGTNSSSKVAVVSGADDRSIGVHTMTVVDGTPWLVTFDLESSGDIPSRVVRIDPVGGTFEELGELGRWPRGIAHLNGFLWVTDCADATVTQVDPKTGEVVGDPILVGTPAPEDLEEAESFSCLGEAVVHGSTLWVCELFDGTIIPVELGA